MHIHKTVTYFAIVLLGFVCAACGEDEQGTTAADAGSGLDVPLLDLNGSNGSTIVPMSNGTTLQDSGTSEDTTQTSDAFIDEPFDRDAFNRDTSEPPDTTELPTDAALPSASINGQTDCYEWLLETQSTVFTLKVDNFFVTYEVRNTCAQPIRVRTEHLSDMFPVGIQKNGEPWIFLPDCLGIGDPVERIFNTGDGWRRGWIWTTDDHEARLMRCNVTFEPGADYAIVGYGLTEVPFSSTVALSEIFPLTDPIPITLQLPEE